MRFSDLAGKELVDIREGVRLGELGDAELVFETATGRVHSIAVLPRGPWWHRSRELVIPWAGVRKIGVDVIVVDLGVSAGAGPADLREHESANGTGSADDRGRAPVGNGSPGWNRDAEGGGAFFFRRR